MVPEVIIFKKIKSLWCSVGKAGIVIMDQIILVEVPVIFKGNLGI